MNKSYLILILLIYTSLISGGSVYFWQKFINKTSLSNDKKISKNLLDGPREEDNAKETKEKQAIKESKEKIIEYSVLKPENVVKLFYTWYLNYANGIFSDNETHNPLSSEGFKNSEYLNKDFVKKIIKMDEDGLFYDPIVCGQDFPDSADSIILNNVKILNDKAVVDLYLHPFNEKIKVELNKVNGTWKINNVECPKD